MGGGSPGVPLMGCTGREEQWGLSSPTKVWGRRLLRQLVSERRFMGLGWEILLGKG